MASSNDVADPDRKFQEDLAKAQALSLESLALETFQRQRKFRSNTSRTTDTPTDNRQNNTLRNITPSRPGSFRSQRVPRLAPPPTVQRRNSAAATVCTATVETNASDLISFSPSPTEKKNAFQDFQTEDIEWTSQIRTKLDFSNTSSPATITNYSNAMQNPLSTHINSAPAYYRYALTSYSGHSPGSNNYFPVYNATTPKPPEVQTQPQPFTTSASATAIMENDFLNVLKIAEQRVKPKSNLTDLMSFDKSPEDSPNKTSRIVSVLEAFDPLMTTVHITQENPAEEVKTKGPEAEDVLGTSTGAGDADDDSECSFYNPYDPFDLYAPGEVEVPVYATVNKKRRGSETPPPPLPPRPSAWTTLEKRRGTIDGRQKARSRLYENIKVVKRRAALHDTDLQEFHAMVKLLRAKFPNTDLETNVGLVISPLIESPYVEGTNIKLVVHSKPDVSPITFVCDVSTTIQHVILHIVCELEGDLSGAASDYFLKVWGLAEYFSSDTCLADYEYIHQCLKLEEDVVLAIVHSSMLQRPLARTQLDDNRDVEMSLEDLLPNEPVQPISYDTLLILLETVEGEMERVLSQAADRNSCGMQSRIQVKGVVQAVKAICALMGNIETQDISEAVDALKASCNNPAQDVSERWVRPEIIGEDGDFSMVTLRPHSVSDVLPTNVAIQLERVRDAIQSLIETYCQAFRVDFHLNSRAELPSTSRLSCDILDTVVVHVGCLHRLLQGWQHDEFFLTAQIFHGTQPVGHQVVASPSKRSTNFFDRVRFNVVLNFPSVSVCMLPLEARVVIVLYGQTVLPPESGDEEPQIQKQELGWAATQFFSYQGMLVQGSFLLSCWPTVTDKRLGPAPAAGTHPQGHNDPVLWVELPDYGGSRIVFPPKRDARQNVQKHDFNSLDHNTQQQLLTIVEQDPFTRPPMEEREVLWEKRHYLHSHPQALPKVLLAAHSWDWACLSDLHSMLHSWAPMEPVNALQLLLPCFPDMEVRRKAVEWISLLSSDELVDYLPQLVQALKHQTFETSPLAEFLLEQALISPRVAHHLYWLLMQTLPGQCPQNSSETLGEDDLSLSEARYHRRLQLMLRALFAVSGEALRRRFLSQQLLVKNMFDIAESVKSTKESLRLKVLAQELGGLHHSLEDSPTCLPLSPSLEVAGVQVRTSSYFPSNTLPLKINFLSSETGIIPAIFKVGDDLQQDMLTLQMVRIMDKLWLKEGLDLKMVTFACVPTGVKRGMIEMVSNAETLRKIQVELGLTGSFKDRPIAEWLAKHNPATFEYERAVGNFTASCAGYSVATYILGICDRHNDNIMLKTSGHLFHIDFGKFLGDAQMFGNFKRDRTPFVLTSDMAYVINGGERPTAKFHHFVDLCCQAFNIVRKHGNLLLNLFGLMASAGIPGVTMDAVCYVQRALLPGRSNAEAAAMFTRMIESSLKSWFTQFNFFLHNIAQLRFTGDHNDGELLSFIPKTYTMQQEGRIHSVCVHGYQKRYDPEKYYVYIIKVERASQPDPAYLFRSYKEFCELHQKLCILFPLAKCHSLPTGRSMGRSNIKQVAERRRSDIEQFLRSLFRMADEISHSDVVYTFFHPLLRDQQEANIHALKVKESRPMPPSNSESRRLCGQLKLSLHYSRDMLTVMVHHARGLPLVAAGNEPSPYVKVYLLPDPDKRTKRKTKVVRRNCHPTFMEMLEYRRMSLEVAQCRTLQATVWNHDTLQENEFLGGVNLPLSAIDLLQETVEWYSLGNVNRA